MRRSWTIDAATKELAGLRPIITLLRDRGLHEQADQLVANWEQIATMQARIEQLTQDLAEQRKSNEKYAALHGVSNWEQ